MALTEKQKNILLILRHIIKARETSAAEIAEVTGLSFATISRALGVIKQLGMLLQLGSTHTEMMGRKPERIAINSNYGYLLHFYVETDKIRGWLADFSTQAIDSDYVEITRDVIPGIFSVKLEKLARRLFQKNGIPFSKLLAASMAVPGMVDEKNQRIAKIPNLYRLQNANLFAYAKKVLDVPVLIANEARMCVLGEYLSNRGEENIAYVDITKYNGIGAGIMLDGKLFTGSNTIAGELGDIFVGTESFDGAYSEQQGCLETVAGLDTLVANVKSLLAEDKANIMYNMSLPYKDRSITLSMIEEAAMQGDPDVLAVYEDVIKRWCLAIINLYVILGPQDVILGGAITPKNRYTLERMRDYLSKAIYHDFSLRISDLGEIAQLRGGLHMLGNYVFDNTVTTTVLDHLTALQLRNADRD